MKTNGHVDRSAKDGGATSPTTRRRGPLLVSFAQNAEDIRLWRALGAQPAGFYVDVGAGDPVTDSVTKLFYDAGWCGINVEPGPSFPALVSARPRDVNLEVAIAVARGTRELWVSSPDPGLSSFRPPDERLPEGFSFSSKTVQAMRLDEVVRQHAPGRPIDFLKIDAEGAEQEILASVDLRAIRPKVLVIEAVSPLAHRPTQDDWEPALLDAGYVHAAFDGINRFYVSPEHLDLIDVLAYPVSPLDRFQTDAYLRLHASVTELTREVDRLRDPDDPPKIERLEADLRELRGLIDGMERSLSWRITRPLRAARRVRTTLLGARGTSAPPMRTATLQHEFATRVERAAALIDGDSAVSERPSVDVSLDRLAAAMSTWHAPVETVAWLTLVAVSASYPDEREWRYLAWLFQRSSPEAVTSFLNERFAELVASGTAPEATLDVVQDAVVVDATQILTSNLQRGIPRVAREAVSRWLEADTSVCVACWDERRGVLRRASKVEVDRLRTWQSDVDTNGEEAARPSSENGSDAMLLPWHCRVVVVELTSPKHSRALTSLASSTVNSLSAICYDLIPLVAPEVVPRGLSRAFLDYLVLLKTASRVSAISQQTAADLRAFTTMLGSEGLVGPEIAAHPLPSTAPVTEGSEARAMDAAVDPPGSPLVLVVGPHEDRKNHRAVLRAAERLWEDGHAFSLLFVGASSVTGDSEFDRDVALLAAAGRPVHVRGVVSEAELWSAYRAARFSVFPSLIEGFGLPIVESLAVGTPVITSRHGSMGEIAAGGGVLVIDPRSLDELEIAMGRLLEDEALLKRLRAEAKARDLGSWDAYARDVWSFLVGDAVARGP
jgi:FkbM family methyltransferase